MLINRPHRYGLVAVFLHWIIAITVVVEFSLGLFMTGMGYYDPMSQLLPHIHESLGVLLAIGIVVRIGWSMINCRPTPGRGVGPLARLISRLVQRSMHVLLVAIVVFGYLLSTAEGEGIPVFDWFVMPALMNPQVKGEEDLCLLLHLWLAWILMGLVFLHMAGALKHHFWDHDETLRKMLGLKKRP